MSDSYRPGNRADFDLLYRTSYNRVRYLLMNVLRDPDAADDCAQETFVRAYKAWPRWQPSAPAEAWLHRIALNVAISYRRSEKLRGIGEVLRRFGSPPPGADPATNDEATLLRRALRKIPPEQAAAIVLRHHHGYSNREIAQALGISESTVATRLATAKKRLQAELARLGFESGSDTSALSEVKDGSE